jgi:hypothetical protein
MKENKKIRLQSDNEEILGGSELLEHASLYYKNLFGRTRNSWFQLYIDLWKRWNG